MGSHIVENPPALRLRRFAGLFVVLHLLHLLASTLALRYNKKKRKGGEYCE
jgi:hypothetical protein